MAKGEKVLVTGATGFIGTQVVGLLLKKGYHVRAAVRNQKKADALEKLFASYKDQLEFVFVDLAKPESFNTVLGDISGIFHVAAPLPGSFKTSVKEDFLDPAIEGNLAIMRAAAKTPSVKRIVLTSSKVSIMNASTDPAHVYTEKDWNPTTYEDAQKLDGAENDLMMYIASKTLAEKAAWDFVRKEKPHYDLVTILPAFVFGPAESNAETQSDISTLKYIADYITNKTKVEPAQGYEYVVDVRDVAFAEVAAYENPKSSGQRYIIAADHFAWQEIVEVAHKDFKGKTNAPPYIDLPLPEFMKVDHSKSVEELGVNYHKKHQTFHDSIASILALREAGKQV